CSLRITLLLELADPSLDSRIDVSVYFLGLFFLRSNRLVYIAKTSAFIALDYLYGTVRLFSFTHTYVCCQALTALTCLSIMREIASLLVAPTTRSFSVPSLNSINVGIPLMPYLCDTLRLSSTFTLTT